MTLLGLLSTKAGFLRMFEFAAITYGLLASIILSAAQRNRKLAKPHPPMLLYVGYLLCGLSGGLAIALAYIATTRIAG
jgi:MFS family permease